MKFVLAVYFLLILSHFNLYPAYGGLDSEQQIEIPEPPQFPPQAHDLDFAYLTEAAGDLLKSPETTLNTWQMIQFLEAVDHGNSNHIHFLFSWFSPEVLIRESLYLFKKDRITEPQMSTINYFCSAIEQFIVTEVKRQMESVNSQTQRNRFKVSSSDSWAKRGKFNRLKVLRYDDPLVAEYFQLDNRRIFPFSGSKVLFYQRMKREPSIERRALLMPVPSKNPSEWSPLYAEISGVLESLTPIEFPEGTNQYSIVIPSDTILQTLIQLSSLNSRGQGEPVKVLHKFGKLSSLVTGRAAASHSWVINLQHPDLPGLMIADRHYAGLYVFSLHDAYHAIRWSRMGHQDNAVLARIKAITLNYRSKYDPQKRDKNLSLILSRLTDGELHDSRKGETLWQYLFNKRDAQFPDRLLFEWPSKLLIEILSEIGPENDQKLPPAMRVLLHLIVSHGESGKKQAETLAPVIRAVRMQDLSELKNLIEADLDCLKDLLIFDQTPLLVYFGLNVDQKYFETLLGSFTEHVLLNQRYPAKFANQTPAMGLIHLDRCDLLRGFVNAGADLSLLDADGYSALIYAAMKSSSDCLNILLQSGKISSEMINRKYGDGDNPITPLMAAARYGSLANVELLLNFGADPKVKTKHGFQAVDLVGSSNRNEILELFKKAQN